MEAVHRGHPAHDQPEATSPAPHPPRRNHRARHGSRRLHGASVARHRAGSTRERSTRRRRTHLLGTRGTRRSGQGPADPSTIPTRCQGCRRARSRSDACHPHLAASSHHRHLSTRRQRADHSAARSTPHDTRAPIRLPSVAGTRLHPHATSRLRHRTRTQGRGPPTRRRRYRIGSLAASSRRWLGDVDAATTLPESPPVVLWSPRRRRSQTTRVRRSTVDFGGHRATQRCRLRSAPSRCRSRFAVWQSIHDSLCVANMVTARNQTLPSSPARAASAMTSASPSRSILSKRVKFIAPALTLDAPIFGPYCFVSG